MTAAGWLLALLGAAGLWLAGNHYASGWALFAGAQVLSLPAALAGEPYALVPLVAGCGLVAVHHYGNRNDLDFACFPQLRNKFFSRIPADADDADS